MGLIPSRITFPARKIFANLAKLQIRTKNILRVYAHSLLEQDFPKYSKQRQTMIYAPAPHKSRPLNPALRSDKKKLLYHGHLRVENL